MKKITIGLILLSLMVNLISLILFSKSSLVTNSKTSVPTVLWLVSIITFGISVFLQHKKKVETKKIITQTFSLNEFIFIFIVFSIGLFVRLYKIDFKGLYLDEWYWLDQARGVLKGTITSPFGYIGDQPSNLPAYVVAFFLALLKNSFLAVRIPGVLYSMLNCLFVFLFLKEAFNKKVALIGLTLLSTSIWDIHTSQLGWNNVTINPFLISGTMLFFYKGLKRSSFKDIFFGSVLLGMSINLMYVASLNTIVIFIYFLYQLFINENKQRVIVFLIFTIFTIFLVSSPTLIKIYKNKNQTIGRHISFFNENVNYSHGVNKHYYIDQMKVALLDFIPTDKKYDNQMFWVITLEPLVFFLFILGLLIFVRKINKSESVLVATNFIIMFIPVVVLYRTTSVWRQYGFLPSIYIITSIGAYHAIKLISKTKFFHLLNKRKITYIYFLLIYVFSLFYYISLYNMNILTEKKDSYENLCRNTTDYISLNIPKNSLILLPNEMCTQLLSMTLLDSYQYLTYDDYELIFKYLQSGQAAALVTISANSYSSEFNKKNSFNIFQSKIDSVKNHYKLYFIKDKYENIFSMVYFFK